VAPDTRFWGAEIIAGHHPQILQSALNAIIAPGTIFTGHPEHKFFNLGIDSGPSRIGAMRGAVELLGDQLAMPGQDRIRFNDRGDFLERLSAELFTNLGSRHAFGVGKLNASRDLVA